MTWAHINPLVRPSGAVPTSGVYHPLLTGPQAAVFGYLSMHEAVDVLNHPTTLQQLFLQHESTPRIRLNGTEMPDYLTD